MISFDQIKHCNIRNEENILISTNDQMQVELLSTVYCSRVLVKYTDKLKFEISVVFISSFKQFEKLQKYINHSQSGGL